MVTGEQVRAGRALIRWEQGELAARAKVSTETVKRIERAKGPAPGLPVTVDAVRRALVEGGVIFIDENGGGAGVRLRKG